MSTVAQRRQPGELFDGGISAAINLERYGGVSDEGSGVGAMSHRPRITGGSMRRRHFFVHTCLGASATSAPTDSTSCSECAWAGPLVQPSYSSS